MTAQIKISIPQPCHEGWQNMLPAEKGRFCQTCQKCVIDFSEYTDTEIIKYLTQNTGKTCGRFSPEQLNRNLEIENPYPAHRYYKFFAGIALFLGLQQFSYSQITTPTPGLPTEQSGEGITTPVLKTPQKTVKKDSLITITGQVLDSTTHEPILGASVVIKGTSLGASTDFDGTFKLAIPSYNLNDSTLLVVKIIGYKTHQTPVTPYQTNQLKIYLSDNDLLIEGDVVICTKRKSRWIRFKRSIARLLGQGN
jgi:hypothetical protein